MLKKLAGIFLLVAVFAAGIFIGQSFPGGENKEIMLPADEHIPELVILYPGDEPKNWANILREINLITMDHIGVTVQFIFDDIADIKTTGARMLASGQQLDLMVAAGGGGFWQFVTSGQVIELNGLLATDGQDILKLAHQERLDECSIEGGIYGIPNRRDYGAIENSWILNRDILNRNGIDPGQIKSMKDLEKAFAVVHDNEPEMVIVRPTYVGLLSNLKYFANDAMDPIGVPDENTGGQYINLFTSRTYYNELTRVRRWFQLDYLRLPEQDLEKSAYELMGEGRLLAYPVQAKPGILAQEKRMCQNSDALCCVSLGEAVAMGGDGAKCPWIITANTINASKSMQLLNLMYKDPEITNLLAWGIDGVDYTVDENQQVASSNVEGSWYTWVLPNQFLTRTWKEDPEDLWVQMEAFNSSCEKSGDTGFFFDVTSVYTQYLDCAAIYSRYKPLLENGVVDIYDSLAEMNSELREAGIEEVIGEKNKQYASFLQRR